MSQRQPGQAEDWLVSKTKVFILVVRLLFALLALSANAQTNSAPEGNRFLLIVEISKSMDARGNGALRAIQDLLLSGMYGQMQDGDTLGIWTYNNQLYTGRFPLQHWSVKNQRSTAEKGFLFVRAQTCEKQGNLNLVVPALEKLIKTSRVLTVVIVTDGKQKLHGTDFDEPINQLYDAWRDEQEKARMPVITVLRATAGKWTDFRVTAAPWPIEMPPLPKNQIADNREKMNSLARAAAAKPSPPRGTNLFLSGKKTTTSEKTNELIIANPGSFLSPGTTSLSTLPGSTNLATTNIVVITSRKTAKEQDEISKPLILSQSSTNQPVELAQLAKPSNSQLVAPGFVKTDTGIAPPDTSPTTAVVPQSDIQVAEKSSIQQSALKADAAVKGSKGTEVAKISEQTVEPHPDPTQKASSPSKTGDSAESSTASKTGASTGSRGSLATAIQGSGASKSFLLPVVIVTAGLTVALVLFWAAKSRSNKHISLITRSLDHKK